MSVHDSWKLLVKTAYGDTTPNDKVYKDGKNVVEALGCLALAVAQAGAYIRETSFPLKEYFDLARKRCCGIFRSTPVPTIATRSTRRGKYRWT
jgi:hypothetical protein